MSNNNKMEADDVRALFSDHLEGTLEPSVHQEVDAALAADPQLALERKAFEHTVNLLRALPKSDAPDDLVGKVRDRLAQERRAQQREPAAIAAPSSSSSPAPRRRFGFEVVAGFAAAAAVIAVVVVGAPALQHKGSGGNDGTMTAGTSSTSALNLSWRAPGIERIDVVEAAQAAGLARNDDGSFAGDRQAAARFLVALKVRAAAHGADVSGHVPEAAERVVVVVTP